MFYGEFISDCDIWQEHKELAYIENRSVSGIFRTKLLTPTPSPPSECDLPPKAGGGGVTNSPGGEGVGINISEDARHWIGFLQ